MPRREGRIHVRRGAGAVVTQARVDHATGARSGVTGNLAEPGHAPGRSLLRCEELPASPREAEAPELAAGDPVVLGGLMGAADGVPLFHSRNFHPARRLPGIAAALARTGGVTAALREAGVTDCQRRWTPLVAEPPEPLIARHLRLSERAPVLRSENLGVDADGRPVEYGTSWFCSARIALVLDRSCFA